MTDEDLKKIGELISNSEERIISEVGNFIGSSILPQLEEKADKPDIDRIEKKLDRVLDKSLQQDKRLFDIESIPAIPHDLKSKKVK